MATVDKNFRIKNGLVVEGSTATVNGNDILTKKQADQDYIVNLIGGTATSANEANKVVKRDSNGDFSAGTITADLVGNVTGTVSSLSNHDTDDLSEGSTNKYFTNQRALDATSAAYDPAGSAATAQSNAEDYADGLISTEVTNRNNAISTALGTAESYADGVAATAQTNAQNYADGLASNYDPAGSASTAQTNAQNYADTAASNAQTAAQNYADSLASNYDAAGAASAAEGNANTYTDNAINALTTDDIEEGTTNKYFSNTLAREAVSAGTGISYDSGTGVISVDNTIATQSYVDTAIDNLVDGAPGLLDTLNEIAAAINDDANYFTTVANSISEKVAKSGDTMTGALTLHADPTNALHAATKQYVDQAESDAVDAANSYTDSAIAAGNATAEPVYAAIDFNGIAKNVAASVSVPTASTVTAYQWNHNGFTSGKFTVKVAAGTHTELSELLVTSDTSNNVHLTEYGIVGTNGALSSISADFDSNKIRIRVTTLNSNSTVVVAGTLIGS
jgi:hypothetical protein